MQKYIRVSAMTKRLKSTMLDHYWYVAQYLYASCEYHEYQHIKIHRPLWKVLIST